MTVGRSAFYRDGICHNLADMADLHPLPIIRFGSVYRKRRSRLPIRLFWNPAYTDSYTGLCALFCLPVDPALADAARAVRLLRQAGLK